MEPVVLGFSDVDDLAFLSRDEIARRLGYARASSANRALEKIGAALPLGAFRGLVRGDIVKSWAARLPAAIDRNAGGKVVEPKCENPPAEHPSPPAGNPERDEREARPTGRPKAQRAPASGRAAGLNVTSLDDARIRLRAKIREAI